ncbi:16S rRNA (cytidine(1402)-2'-O)-methyltransferase [Prauserella alba]|uniref:16S rRNA (cytidine(1402)-2'-O)-methyltransferase n=1 Tax=Prauserella alba TaxID=176898 RepID=UPI0031E4276B
MARSRSTPASSKSSASAGLRSLTTALDVAPVAKVVSFYEDVESARLPKLLDAVREGDTVVLVTDAGMPSVSDPGFRLVAACAEEELPVSCVPGPSAVTTALALSGLAPDRFCFDGFAPRKPGERARWFAELADEKRTTVFFESPHRLASLLADAAERLGADRRGAVCRELTKTYEQVRRGTLGELAEWAADGVRGEITVVLAGAAPRDVSVADLVDEVTRRVEAGERLKAVAAEVAKETGVSKKELYDAVVAARAD